MDRVVGTVKQVFTELTARSRNMIGAVCAALVIAAAYSLLPGVAGDSVWGNVPFTALTATFAGAGVWMAVQLPVTVRARSQAFMLAASIAAYTMGDLVWMYYEIGQGIPAPYPGLADLFYGPAMYLPLTVAVWSALLSLRRLESSMKPFVISGSVTVLAALALWGSVLVSVVDDASADLLTMGVSIGYPLADVFLLLFPTLALIVALADVGGVPLARPWYSIASAMLVLAITDSVYAYQQAHGTYVSGSLLDMGWVLAFGMIVVGISRMLDVYSAEE